jgi:hypothetical protein
LSATIAANAACTSQIELDALACSGGTVSRAGDTLRFRVADARDRIVVSSHSDAGYAYQYVGRIGPATFHLVEEFGGDHPPYFLVLNPRSGRSVEVSGPPVMSPDGARFATAIPAWDCAESPDQRLEIWHFTDSIPVREASINQLRCAGGDTTSGWAALDPVWRSRDTLAFTMVEQSPERRRQAVLARNGGEWRLVAPAP